MHHHIGEEIDPAIFIFHHGFDEILFLRHQVQSKPVNGLHGGPLVIVALMLRGERRRVRVVDDASEMLDVSQQAVEATLRDHLVCVLPRRGLLRNGARQGSRVNDELRKFEELVGEFLLRKLRDLIDSTPDGLKLRRCRILD